MLKEKTEIICLNKVDSVSEEELAEKMKILNNLTGQKIYPISGYTGNGIEIVLKKTLEAVKAWQNPEE